MNPLASPTLSIDLTEDIILNCIRQYVEISNLRLAFTKRILLLNEFQLNEDKSNKTLVTRAFRQLGIHWKLSKSGPVKMIEFDSNYSN